MDNKIITIKCNNGTIQTMYDTICNFEYLKNQIKDSTITTLLNLDIVTDIINNFRGYPISKSRLSEIENIIQNFDHVKINIGGKIYILSKKVLTSNLIYFNGFFNFNEHLHPDYTSILIDRCNILFNKVMDYVSKPTLTQLSTELKSELEFYAYDNPVIFIDPPVIEQFIDEGEYSIFRHCIIDNNDNKIFKINKFERVQNFGNCYYFNSDAQENFIILKYKENIDLQKFFESSTITLEILGIKLLPLKYLQNTFSVLKKFGSLTIDDDKKIILINVSTIKKYNNTEICIKFNEDKNIESVWRLKITPYFINDGNSIKYLFDYEIPSLNRNLKISNPDKKSIFDINLYKEFINHHQSNILDNIQIIVPTNATKITHIEIIDYDKIYCTSLVNNVLDMENTYEITMLNTTVGLKYLLNITYDSILRIYFTDCVPDEFNIQCRITMLD
ncbi:putative BTB/POZ domain-containing protein [Cotonvirus japonicus]|uniref:BTB/POZ domain-containing protein n=1 Tax=Cotonvirus japonicus TaxID=2811091 RepID=A0ABM7NTB7_9VIRU|nr:putative BTB/POZ domain-containing protein [Cotonvirus japonicus]BCS83341.1 putative BTB/POZ domain-containing protein [Cotonvirus japonicus]